MTPSDQSPEDGGENHDELPLEMRPTFGGRSEAIVHSHQAIEADVSRLLVQLVQVLLAFVLGQALVQGRGVLVDIEDPANWIGLAAMAVLIGFAVESWIDWQIDVAQHPFRVGMDREGAALTRLWFDIGHVLAVGYLSMTLVHMVDTPDASLVRHLGGYVAAYVLILASTLIRDLNYGRHTEVWKLQAMSGTLMLVVWVAVILTRSLEARVWVNGIALAAVAIVNINHHRRMRSNRSIV